VRGILTSLFGAWWGRRSAPPTARRERKRESIAVAFCGLPHSLRTGFPLSHRCHVLPLEALNAELNGNHRRAVLLFSRAASAGPLVPHSGCWNVRRRA
jgi:hypothetical protein